tara:strand:+ start:334 stop:546 length:213 start_codon:yes stop_codon:yes gene_type:complete
MKIDLTYEEVELLANLLSKEITELGIENDTRFPNYFSALKKLSECKENWYARKSEFSNYSDYLQDRHFIP